MRHLKRKGGGRRSGRGFQCTTSTGCSSETFDKLFLAPLGTLGRVYQPRGSGGVCWGGGEMRPTDKQVFVLSVSPDLCGGCLGVPTAGEPESRERSLTPWSCHSEGRETPNKALCSPSRVWFPALLWKGEAMEHPGASQCISITEPAVLSNCSLCHSSCLGSIQSSSKCVICYL